MGCSKFPKEQIQHWININAHTLIQVTVKLRESILQWLGLATLAGENNGAVTNCLLGVYIAVFISLDISTPLPSAVEWLLRAQRK